ncbi:hypothetical protein SAMN03159293_04189 [Pseudomonas sp. NFACC39-1]|nr:hypothetical protein SAMN03159293_04189 [Pseudomonas sp. NFACC39-1]
MPTGSSSFSMAMTFCRVSEIGLGQTVMGWIGLGIPGLPLSYSPLLQDT